jgi:hypothetical protein
MVQTETPGNYEADCVEIGVGSAVFLVEDLVQQRPLLIAVRETAPNIRLLNPNRLCFPSFFIYEMQSLPNVGNC